MNVGVFIHFDYAMGGQLANENRCYNDIFNHPNVDKIYVFDYKGKYAEKICPDFNFEYTRVLVNSDADKEKFNKVDILFTWDGYQDFFAGTISPKAVEVYKILSYFTNELNKKLYYRVCDVKHFVKDYKRMIADRNNGTESGNKFAERNSSTVNSLKDIKSINYDNVYYLCNGSRTIRDWSWETLTHSMPFLDKELIKQNSVYMSDDILFRYTECYDKNSHLTTDNKVNALYQVGNLNNGKTKKIKNVLKNTEGIKLYLRTVKRSANAPLYSIPCIEMLETPIYREEMYAELNKYIAYFFVGKGDDYSAYFNKTLYDASIARTVFLIYKKIDQTGIYHELSDYYFNDDTELKEKFEWIKQDYSKHLAIQREVLLKNLSTEVVSIFEHEVEKI